MAQREAEGLTQAQYAAHRKANKLPGGSREAVRRAVDEGRIGTINGKIYPQIADTDWAKNTRTRLSPQAASTASNGPELPLTEPAAPPAEPQAADPGPRDSDYTAARARRERADAESAELELHRKKGLLVQREDVDRAFFEMFREVRDRLAATAKRTAAEVSSLTSAEACETVIEREHRIVLELLTTSFREKVGASPGAASA